MTEEELKKAAKRCHEVMEFQIKNQQPRAHAGGACPNCGYCPHCGRSNARPIWPAPYRYWPNPFYTAPSVTPGWTFGGTTDSIDCEAVTGTIPFVTGTSVTGVKE